ncbi:MAG TPA: MtnX-like HAD-IB family phosphatase [Dehalococcoidia bacterium]|nr:MtnX-like HAD-IB family phosphatase [Dehalococcoidia bacterium]
MRTTESNSGSASLRLAVLTDFDDTAADQNVAELLLDRFADRATWLAAGIRFRAGELTLKDYQEIAFRNIRAGRDTMQTYVKQNANLRPYFGEMVNYCRDRDIPVAVVSAGLDFYVEALLEQEGFPDVPVYAVNTTFSDAGISFRYHHARPGKEHLGNSKGLIVERYRSQGHQVFYVGDGRSDFEAAQRADVVFAHSVLAEECRSQSIPYHPFAHFGDVLSALQEHSSIESIDWRG